MYIQFVNWGDRAREPRTIGGRRGWEAGEERAGSGRSKRAGSGREMRNTDFFNSTILSKKYIYI